MVAVGRQNANFSLVRLDNGNVERASAEIVNQVAFVGSVRLHAVGERGGSWFV